MDIDAPAPIQPGTEIAFVPRSERKTLATAGVEDTIILVGQRAKKRKRKDTKSASSEPNGDGPASGSTSAKVKKTRSVEAEVDGDDDSEKPFDFSSVPNILDDEPIKEDAKPKRQRKQSGKGLFGIRFLCAWKLSRWCALGEVFGYGNFPRPPKAHSELRSGNQSHTFKK